MERFLRGLRLVLVGFLMVGAVMMWAENSAEARAASAPGRRLNTALSMTLDKITMAEFAEAGLAEPLKKVAKLDLVTTTCEVPGMLPAMVDGVNVEDGVSSEERAAMLYNTWVLQNALSCAEAHTAVYMPAGVFYFVSGHLKMHEDSHDLKKFERHVIRPRSYVDLIGRGTDEDGRGTVLKPYSEKSEFENNALARQLRGGDDGFIKGGLDMFFFNDYSALGFPKDPAYLVDADFYDFTINSEHTEGADYGTSGKGFMINLFRDCEWDNIVVKNTDGTGFGIDSPINGKITNSRAEHCGWGGKERGHANVMGASGFGIGFGYAENETMLIEDCEAIDNYNFGFFFEHQGRFDLENYTAMTAAGERAFRVNDCVAKGNYYNYGGQWANDVFYTNSVSEATAGTELDIFFRDSRRVALNNIEIQGRAFTDVKSGEYYTEAVDWARKNGITVGVERGRFGVGDTIKRGDAIVMLWRLNGYPGEVLGFANNNVQPLEGLPNRGEGAQAVQTCFEDVKGNTYYAAAVRWAYQEGITTGTRSCSSAEAKDGLFSPEKGLTRAEFVTMLWRTAGSPSVAMTEKFEDVAPDAWYYDAAYWAAANGITNGVGENKFAPDYDCTREQAVTMLHRFAQLRR